MKPEDQAAFDKFKKDNWMYIDNNDNAQVAFEAALAHRDAQPVVAVNEPVAENETARNSSFNFTESMRKTHERFDTLPVSSKEDYQRSRAAEAPAAEVVRELVGALKKAEDAQPAIEQGVTSNHIDYKRWYNEALLASNEAGYVAFSPAETIRDLIRRVDEFDAQLDGAPQHPDDKAVDIFAKAMKAKLALAREKGRAGWERMGPAELSEMLREHVDKGDPRDVANFCMFLWSLGQPITPYAPAVAVNSQMLKALYGLLAIVSDSEGVAGYHLNGAIAKWDEFEEVEAAGAAIAAAAEAEQIKKGDA